MSTKPPTESRFLQDIGREPGELRAILASLLGPQREALEEAARLLRKAPVRWIAGMGSSFHGGHAVQAFFDAAGRPARNVEAGELLHFAKLPPRSTLLVMSRSGLSVEIVELLERARRARATVIGVTNDPDSPLARKTRPALLLGVPFDFNVSVTMYSGVALAGALAAAMAVGAWREEHARDLDRALHAADRSLGREGAARKSPGFRREIPRRDRTAGGRRAGGWRAAIELAPGRAWWRRDAATILLARGPGLAAALEARQLFEEAAKHPATALSTGAFRHGPNEIVRPGCRVVLWLAEDARLRALDLALASDLRKAGAKLALVGTALPPGAADVALELPRAPLGWQFLLQPMPVRLLVEAAARARGADCDRFDFCPFVVTSEAGLGRGDGPR